MTTTPEQIKQLAMDMTAFDPEIDDPAESLESGMFQLMVATIVEYARITEYTRWSELSHDIAEQFECDWIHPNEEQLAYLAARHLIVQFEHNHGKCE